MSDAESKVFGKYLQDPNQIKFALENLEKNSNLALSFEERYVAFERDLKIENGDGLPITAIHLAGPTIRARPHELGWNEALNVSEIGVNPNSVQGRAHTNGYTIFYGANRKKTAALEVLQGMKSGEFEITIGIWQSPMPLRLVNFVDGANDSFSKIPFVHSMHLDYLKDWPELERRSAILLLDFFKDKFKQTFYDGLYNMTNVLAGFCFSLQEIDGIGYGSISDDFEGYNIALRTYNSLKCEGVERWKIIKLDNRFLSATKIRDGSVNKDGSIHWV